MQIIQSLEILKLWFPFKIRIKYPHLKITVCLRVKIPRKSEDKNNIHKFKVSLTNSMHLLLLKQTMTDMLIKITQIVRYLKLAVWEE